MKWNATIEGLILHLISQKWMAEYSCLWGGGQEVGSGRRVLSFLPLQYFDKNKRERRKKPDFEEDRNIPRLITQFPTIHSGW